jgi:hypothetical protein
MKLVYCPNCDSIISLRENIRQYCFCKKSWGEYTDDLNATISGKAIPLGFENRSFVAALKKRPEYGQGKEFMAFVIPRHCPTITEELSKPLEEKGKK